MPRLFRYEGNSACNVFRGVFRGISMKFSILCGAWPLSGVRPTLCAMNIDYLSIFTLLTFELVFQWGLSFHYLRRLSRDNLYHVCKILSHSLCVDCIELCKRGYIIYSISILIDLVDYVVLWRKMVTFIWLYERYVPYIFIISICHIYITSLQSTQL